MVVEKFSVFFTWIVFVVDGEIGLGRRGSNLRVVNEHLHKFRDGYLTLQENEFFILFLGV